VEFWSGASGLRLTKTINLPDGGQHFFMEGGSKTCSVAYFWFPEAPSSKEGRGLATIDRNFATAHGSVNHIAWNVPRDKLEEYRERVERAGVGFVSPILFHADVPSGFEGGTYGKNNI